MCKNVPFSIFLLPLKSCSGCKGSRSIWLMVPLSFIAKRVKRLEKRNHNLEGGFSLRGGKTPDNHSSEHEATCFEGLRALIRSHSEQSARRGLMTATHRTARPVNLLEAPRRT